MLLRHMDGFIQNHWNSLGFIDILIRDMDGVIENVNTSLDVEQKCSLTPENVNISVDVEQKCSVTYGGGRGRYEIPALLYSLKAY